MSYQVDSYGNAYFPAGVSVASIPATTGTQSRVLVPGPNGRISSATISQLISQSGGNLVTSVYGRTGAVVPRQGDYDTDLVTEGQALYFTNDRSRKSISVTTFNTSGPATYDSTTGILNIPQYGSGIVGNYVPVTRTITINGQTADLSANRIFSIDSMVYPSAGIPLSNGTSWGTSIVNNSANWNTAFGWGNHAGLYSLLGHTHTFASLTSIPTTLAGYGITDAATSAQGTKADTAFSWGNHALAGYLTSFTETDPTVASYIKAITTTNIANWNSAHSWGNHALAGYLTSFTETDPIWTSEKINYYTKLQADARYLQSYTETDPVWTSEKVNYYTKTAADARYLQSYTETDPVWTSEKANYALKTYVDTSISNLVDSAPTTLNTLNELAAALGDDANFSTTITTLIGGKEPAITPGTTTQYWRGDKTWQTLPVYTLSGLGGEPVITAGTTSQYWRGDKTWQTLPIYTLSGLGGQPQLNGTGFVKVTGTTVSYDNSTYLTTSSAASTYLPLTGGTVTGVLSVNSALRIKSGSATGILLETYSTNELRIRVTPVSTTFDMNLVFPSSSRTYTYPNATGTIALTSDIPTLSGLGGVPTTRTLTINGTSYDLSADRSWTISTGISGSGTTNYLSKWTGATSVGNSVAFDNGSAIGINTASPFESSAFKLDVNGGVIIKNTSGTAAQLILIDSNPATGGNNGFVQLSAGGNIGTAFGQWQTYYGTSIASGTLRLQPAGGVVLVGSTTAVTGAGMLQVAGDVNITGTFKINGTPFSSGTSLNGTGFVKASGTTITYDNSTYYLASNPSGYITGYTETDTLSSVTSRGSSTSTALTISGVVISTSGTHGYVRPAASNGTLLLGDDSGSATRGIVINNNGGAVISTAASGQVILDTQISGTSVLRVNGNQTVTILGNTVWHAGNLTNLNQFTNGPGYITSYSETDTLSSVTGRGNTTSSSMAIGSGSIPNGRLYVNSSTSLDVVAIQTTTTGAALVIADNTTPTWANAPRIVGVHNDFYIRTLATNRVRITDGGNTWLYGDLYLGSSNTKIGSTIATGYITLSGSSTNYVGIGPYNNNGWAYFENFNNNNGTYYYVSAGRHAFDGGPVTPYSDGARDLGTSSYRWGNIYTTGALINNSDGAIMMESNASENNNWIFKESSKAWGIFYFNRGSQSGQNIGGSYSSVGAETIFMGQNVGIAMPSGWSGYYNGSKIAAYVDHNTGVMFSAGSMRSPIFYDSDNPAYYLDPNSNSRLLYAQYDNIGVGQAYNSSYRIITSGDIYLNAQGNGWAEGVWKQRRGGGSFYDVIDAGNYAAFNSYSNLYTNTLSVGSDCYAEKVFDLGYFSHGVANIVAYIDFGNIQNSGYLEVEVNSTYSNQNATGLLRKILPFGTNVNGGQWYSGDSKVQEANGSIPDNIFIGDLEWSGSNFRLPIYHVVSSGNSFRARVKYFTQAGNAAGILNGASVSNSTRTAPANWTNNPAYNRAIDTRDIRMFNNNTIGWRYSSGDSGMYNSIYSSYDDTSVGITYRSGGWTSSQSIVCHRFQTQTSGAWQNRLTIYQDGGVIIPGRIDAGNIYAPTYYSSVSTSKYLTNNGSSYGSWYIGGSQGGYSGFRFDGDMQLMMHTNGAAGPCGFWLGNWSILTYVNAAQYLYNNGSEKFRTASDGIVVTGTVYATGDVIAYYSDIRLKKDVTVIDSALDKIQRLRGVTYTWNDEEVNKVKDRAGTRDIGLIAQEVEAVEPLLITEYQTQLNTPSNDPDEANNFVAEMSETYKTIKYEKLVALLVEGMKEQQAQIEELKNEIKELKNK